MRNAELFLKTCDLIAADRRGTKRDDGYHAHWRPLYDRAKRDLIAGLKRINRLLDALTA